MSGEDQRGTVTLQDVARHAGVSLATASRALNGSERRVREDLKARVVASAVKLNYTANAHAQAVARGRTNVLGLVVHDIADPYFSTIAAGVMAAADSRDLLVTLASTGREPDKEVRHVAALRAQRARAVILAGSRRAGTPRRGELARELASFEDSGGRVVMISQAQLDLDTIVLENRAGARHLASSLVECGYRRHAILAGPKDLLTAADRTEGYQRGLASSGLSLPPPVKLHGEFTRDGGYAAMASMLDRIDELDCVFAVNDVMAVGAIAALREHGFTVPRDVAVAGFDDIETLRDVAPGLTTVRLPLYDVGVQALSLVLEPPVAKRRVRRIAGAVILRESTPALTR